MVDNGSFNKEFLKGIAPAGIRSNIFADAGRRFRRKDGTCITREKAFARGSVKPVRIVLSLWNSRYPATNANAAVTVHTHDVNSA